jgi:hypothetical protein
VVAALVDRLEHRQLGAVQMRDDGHLGRDQRGGLVERRQVVQVQDVRAGGAGRRELPRPGRDQVLEDVIRERAHHAVRRARPVLEGRGQRRIGEQRVGRGQRGGEVDGPQVQARVEPARVARAAG